MKTIKLSTQIVKAYQSIKVDVSYALSELAGAVDYDTAGSLTVAPMNQLDPLDYEISDEAYEAMTDVFDGIESIDSVAEIMLWSNYFMGGTL